MDSLMALKKVEDCIGIGLPKCFFDVGEVVKDDLFVIVLGTVESEMFDALFGHIIKPRI